MCGMMACRADANPEHMIKPHRSTPTSMLNIYVSFTTKISPEDIVLIGRQPEMTIPRSTKGTLRLQKSHPRIVSF
jgi:hypothetical protein